MKKWKRLLTSLWVIAFAVIIGWNSGAVKEAKAETYDQYNYIVNEDGGVTITGYTGDETELVIPGEIDGKRVTRIGSLVFLGRRNLTSVIIPDGVTSIGELTFSGCSSLTSIIIPDSVTWIWDQAFQDCSSLTSINIPKGVTRIDSTAFSGCKGLTSINIPESVTDMSSSAFSNCSGLTSITVDGNNKKYDSRGNCNAIIDTETNTLIKGCVNTKIPEGVTSIGQSAFEDCIGLTSINIPDGVTSIGYYAFQDCSDLTSINIPDSVTSIGDKAFQGCSSLATSISIPEGVTSIEFSVFDGCSSLTGISIPEGVTSIDRSAFQDCSSLTSISIPESVTDISSGAFQGCGGLTSITVDGNNKVYDSRENCNAIIETGTNTLMIGCSSTKVPEGVKRIGGFAFYSCRGLTSINIPKSVTSIGDQAFGDCSSLASITVDGSNKTYDSRENCNAIIETGTNTLITGSNSTKIPESVTRIDQYAFYGRRGLTSINIPESVTDIIYNAFRDCSGLTSITVDGNNKKYDSRGNCNAIIETGTNTLILGCSSTEIPEEVTSIGPSAFYGCSGLTSITIPEGVTSIGEFAFSGCSGLTGITIPEGVTSISDYAFYRCSDDLVIWTTINSYADQYASRKRITVKYPGEPTDTPVVSPTPGADTGVGATVTPGVSQPQVQPQPQQQSKPQQQPQSQEIKVTPSPQQPSAASPAIKDGVKTTAGKKKLTLKWKKVTGISGYQVQISLKKNFKGAKKIFVKNSKKSVTIAKLKSGKVYYIRIRTYVENNGKKVYGKWVTEKRKVK